MHMTHPKLKANRQIYPIVIETTKHPPTLITVLDLKMSRNKVISVQFRLTRTDDENDHDKYPSEVDVVVQVKIVSKYKKFHPLQSISWLLLPAVWKAKRNKRFEKCEDDVWIWSSEEPLWSSFRFTDSFLRKWEPYLNWREVSQKQEITQEFIRDHQSKINWSSLCEYRRMDESFIRQYHERVDWKKISEYQTLSETFIREYHECVDWRIISRSQMLSDNFIREFHERVHWANIFMYQSSLSAGLVREFAHNSGIRYLSQNKYVSEDMLREHIDKIYTKFIGGVHIRLSNQFLCDFHDKLNWSLITECQTLDPCIIRKFAHKIIWNYRFHQRIPECIIIEFKQKINPRYLTKQNNLTYEFMKQHEDWLRPTSEMKRHAVNERHQKQMFRKHPIALELIEQILEYV